jgi:hypothetical protein
MRVFISSVRKGLEEERDALPGIISAVGHTPVRFEDFSAQDTPSRQACLDALATADVYLLLLGPQYGHRFPDTGQSPTHEEWNSARAAGMRRIVYCKSGIKFEPEQYALSREIGDYASGAFYDSFSNTPELLTKVAKKLRELEFSNGELDFQALTRSPEVRWRSDIQNHGFETRKGILEVHAVPVDEVPYSGRVMRQFADSMADRIRRTGVVDSNASLECVSSEESVVVNVLLQQANAWDTPRSDSIVGICLFKTGQVSVWSTLPRDSMGEILDPDRLPLQLASSLRLIGALNIVDGGRLAIAIGLDPGAMLTVDKFDPYRSRTRSTGLSMSDNPLRLSPDESVSLSALDEGAAEVAADLARGLIEAFTTGRR